MKIVEKGVLNGSEIYFYNGNTKDINYFYRLICTGYYLCNGQYFVRKNTLNSYLIIYVEEGAGYAIINNKKLDLKKGNMILLNVYERPSYGTSIGWKIKWLHFDGHDINSLFQHLDKVIVRPTESIVDKAFSKILTPFSTGKQPSAAVINKYITNLLTEFFEPDMENYINASGRKFQEIFNYINTNIDKKITINELAQISNLSKYYFIRKFKQETRYTPHNYIIKTRVELAKYLLIATELSLSEITLKCGFTNEGALNNTFKTIYKTTPNVYRKKTK